MFAIIVFAAAMLALGLWGTVRRKWYALGIFNAVWAVVFFFCRRELCQGIFAQTLLLLLMMIIMVNLGYFLSRRVKLSRLERGKFPAEGELNEKLLIILLCVASAIMLFYAVKTLSRFGFDLRAIRKYNNSDSETKIFTSQIDTVLFYGIAMPMCYVGALVLAYHFSQGIKMPPRILILEAVALVLNMLTVAGRSIFLRIALFFVAAILWRMHKPGGINWKIFRYILFAGVALLLVMEISTLARNKWQVSFIEQAMDYIRGAVAHTQYRLNRLDRLPDYGTTYYGYVTYGGFLYYPVKLLSALGVDIKTSNEIMGFLQEMVSFELSGKKFHHNALVPNVFYHYYDSGYMGAMIFPALLGFTAGRSERLHKYPTFFKFVLWATCIYAVVYSPLDGVLWAFRYPTAVIYCFILQFFLFTPARKEQGGQNEEN